MGGNIGCPGHFGQCETAELNTSRDGHLEAIWDNGSGTSGFCRKCAQKHVEGQKEEVKRDANPGFPWCLLGSTNGQLLDNHWETIVDAVLDRLERIRRHGNSIFGMTGAQLVSHGLRDPVRLFVKDEPHKLSKLDSGMLRLISNESLVDQLVTRILSYRQNKMEIANWTTCPSKPGISLDDDGLYEMGGHFQRALEHGPLEASDIKAWDWSVQEWELMADADRRAVLADSKDMYFHFLLRVQAHGVNNAVYVLPDGRLLEGDMVGIQNSGSFNTSSTNSAMRLMVDVRAKLELGLPRQVILQGLEDSSVMGDDSVLPSVTGVTQKVEEFGHSVKETAIFTRLHGVSFCSHTWVSRGVALPENKWKTLYRFFSHPPTSGQYPDWFAQLLYEMRNDTEGGLWIPVAMSRVVRALQTFA
nr:MAG: putative RNA-dependent RNA polymerase [Barnaviridae sp.]